MGIELYGHHKREECDGTLDGLIISSGMRVAKYVYSAIWFELSKKELVVNVSFNGALVMWDASIRGDADDVGHVDCQWRCHRHIGRYGVSRCV